MLPRKFTRLGLATQLRPLCSALLRTAAQRADSPVHLFAPTNVMFQTLGSRIRMSDPGAVLAALQQEAETADTTLVCSGWRWRLHSSLLAVSSPFFWAAVTGDFKERQERVVEVRDIEPDAMQQVLDYMHGIPVAGSSVADLLEAIERFQMGGMKEQVCSMAAGLITRENAVQLGKQAELYDTDRLAGLHLCSQAGAGACTDRKIPKMVRKAGGLSSLVLGHTCVFRRVVAALATKDEMSAGWLARRFGQETVVVGQVVEKLQELAVLGPAASGQIPVSHGPAMKRVLHKYLGIKAEALAGHEAVDVQGGSTDAAMMVTAWWPLLRIPGMREEVDFMIMSCVGGVKAKIGPGRHCSCAVVCSGEMAQIFK